MKMTKKTALIITKESQRYTEITEYRVVITQMLKEAKDCEEILKLFTKNVDLQEHTDSCKIIQQLTGYIKMKRDYANEYEEYMMEAKEYD